MEILSDLKGLERRLFDLPEAKFGEIVRLLEQVRAHPDVQQTFEQLRPRLAELRPARRLTLKRILCDPFEDLLETPGRNSVPVGGIDRAVIDPLWRLVEQRADRKHLDPLRQALAQVAPGDAGARHGIGCRLWYAAGIAIRQALAEADQDPRVRRDLFRGDETMIARIREVVEFIEIGHQIAEVKNALPAKPVHLFTPEHAALVETAVKEVAKIGTGKPYHLLLVVASRLRQPAELLAVLGDMDFGKARREKPLVFARLGALVVTNLEERTSRADGARAAPDPLATVDMAAQLVEGLESTRAVMDAVNETIHNERLETVRTAVRGMVETGVIRPAEQNILTAVPPPPRPGRTLAPPDDTVQTAAEDHAVALKRCSTFASSLGNEFEYALNEKMKAIGKGVGARVDKMLAGVSPAPDDPDNAEALEQSVFYAVRILELVEGSARADEARVKAMSVLMGESPPSGAKR